MSVESLACALGVLALAALVLAGWMAGLALSFHAEMQGVRDHNEVLARAAADWKRLALQRGQPRMGTGRWAWDADGREVRE